MNPPWKKSSLVWKKADRDWRKITEKGLDRGNKDIVVGFSLHTNLVEKYLQQVTCRFPEDGTEETRHTEKCSELLLVHIVQELPKRNLCPSVGLQVFLPPCKRGLYSTHFHSLSFNTWNIPWLFRFLSFLCQKAKPPKSL